MEKKSAIRKRLKPRYLPGQVTIIADEIFICRNEFCFDSIFYSQVDAKFAQMDYTIFVSHRENVEFAEAKIDNRAPKFSVSKRYKPDEMMQDAANVTKTDKQNLELINHINRIVIMGVSL